MSKKEGIKFRLADGGGLILTFSCLPLHHDTKDGLKLSHPHWMVLTFVNSQH